VIQTAKDADELEEEFREKTPLLQKWDADQKSGKTDQ
jgi:hypothetical protein